MADYSIFEPGALLRHKSGVGMEISLERSAAISLKRIADALERQNDLTAQLWLKHGDDAKKPEITGALVNSQGEVSYTNKL